MKQIFGVVLFGLSAFGALAQQNPMFFQSSYSTYITPTAATPTFIPVAGAISSGTTIAITSGTSGAIICYTLNGDTPTAATAGTCDSDSGNEYSISNGGSTSGITTALTVNAIATKSAYVNSTVGSSAYTIAVTHAMSVVQSANLIIVGGGGTNVYNSAVTATPANASAFVLCYTSDAITAWNPVSPTTILTPGSTDSQPVMDYEALTTGTTAIGVTLTGTYSSGSCLIAVVSGIVNSSPIDASSNSGVLVQTSPASTTPSTGSVTTTNTNDVIVAFEAYPLTQTITAGTGYTLIGAYCVTGGSSCVAIEYKNVSSTGTYNPTFTLGASGSLYAGTVALKLQ